MASIVWIPAFAGMTGAKRSGGATLVQLNLASTYACYGLTGAGFEIRLSGEIATPSLNSAERAARDLPPETSFTALSEMNAAAPNLAIHAYDSAIASHKRFARSGFPRLRSHYSLPSDSGQFATGHHGSARSRSRAHPPSALSIRTS